jgi:hypothetical protein
LMIETCDRKDVKVPAVASDRPPIRARLANLIWPSGEVSTGS